ncbi:MAG: redox-regulated ATPase YchF [Lentihominibacter sp.]|nr:redox-regulated ATPase YchF [Clostridiales bacterium]MDD6648001.1 redox-regulated ATPase YchF [Bacillota bacterium]MDY2679644.1 redox-regulated ATPase YchF [Lentihominibacter sp.]
MKLGIVGLPNVGKSTLFNAITKAGAEAANYPFCTIEPNVGVVTVPDERLKVLHEMYNSKKTIYTTIEFYDIAGLVKGASKGEGLGNKFLGHIREVAAIVHVVRCFDDPNVVHVDGKIDPISDIDTINMELILSDMEVLERRIQKTTKNLKGDKSLQKELDLLKKVYDFLAEGKSARAMELDDEEAEFVRSLDLLSYKPVIYAANVSEDDAAAEDNDYIAKVREFAATENSDVIVVCAKIEAEMAELDEDEKAMFLEEMGIGESGLDKLVKASYHLLDLISFLTAGEPEVRAWTIKRGTKAPGAAGKIHSDFEKGFIRAETIAYDKLIECGGNLATAKEKGLIRSEGKEYVVKDGDVIHFLFNV